MPETERQRRLRRAAELLGDIEPAGTRDESAEGWGETETANGREDELRRNVPPHHG